MCTTHMDNQTTCLATMNTVHNIPLVVLHLNLTLAVLHLNLTLAVLHLTSDILVRIFEDSTVGNARKENGFWVAVMKHMHTTCAITKHRTYDMVNGNGRPCIRKLLLFVCDKWNSQELPEFMLDMEEKKSKRYKSSGESSFNTKELGDGHFNLNNTAGDKEDEVQEVRPRRPIDTDQAKRKAKAGTSSAGSATAFDVKSLAKLMANEYTMANDSYNVQKGHEMTELLRIKKQELELKDAELEIRRL
ncbi:hypothetical protein Tco_0960455 [Tanacetum coccineum]